MSLGSKEASAKDLPPPLVGFGGQVGFPQVHNLIQLKIGKDEKGGIDKCAIVTAKYMLNGKEIGHAGVIGPERMDYSKVMGVLKCVAKVLDEINDGGRNGKKRIH